MDLEARAHSEHPDELRLWLRLLEWRAFAGAVWAVRACSHRSLGVRSMAKPGRKVKKANHGKRPACSRPRKSRRQQVKT